MLDELSVRKQRLDTLLKAGLNPYLSHVERSHRVSEVLERFDDLMKAQTTLSLAGRLRLVRKHGGLTFAQLDDGSGMIQLAIRKDRVGEETYSFFHQTIDMGDFIEASGKLFLTQKGERTLEIERYQIITKVLLPLPEKWHGLSDIETRFRKRYLDLLMNPSVREQMIHRSRMITALRSFLDARGFLEVETPTLQPVYGGGFARPFITHHHALDTDFYLRISDEMYLKRLLVGGFEKVYEITKVFRNEGIDHDHNPEFTMFEAQIAYEDYRYGMDLFEEIFEAVAEQILQTTQVQHDGVLVELKRPWKRLRLIEAVDKIGGIAETVWTDRSVAVQALKEKLPNEKQQELPRMKTVGELLAFAFEELVEEKLVQPALIYDYPVEVSPLAKKCENDPRFVERFEAFALGSEIGNNYSELNDPIDLEKRFIEEKEREKAGFDEAHQTDMDYLEAIKHGMPPACGLGIGIDRMAMLLMGVKNIKEVILFPTLRSKTEE